MFIYDKILRQPLKLLQYCISYIIPKNNRIIIYGAWYGELFADNAKYVYLEASKDKSYKNVWISRNKDVVETLKQEGYDAEYMFSAKGIAYQLIAGKAVVCVGYTDLCRPLIAHKKILNLWHGVPLKKIVYDVSKPGFLERFQDIFFRDTRVLYTSRNYYEIYKRCFGKDDNHLFLCGQPRNDVFYDSSLIDQSALKKFKDIVGNGSIVLYMPTHRHEGKDKLNLDRRIDFRRLERFCECHGVKFVIKKHFYHLSEPLVKGFRNIHDISDRDFDAQFLLSQADILLTDYSSCYVDYLLREKPVIFFQYDKEQYMLNERNFYYDNELIQPGPVVETYDQLEEALEQVEKGYSSSQIDKIIIAKDFFYESAFQKRTSGIVWKYIKDM